MKSYFVALILAFAVILSMSEASDKAEISADAKKDTEKVPEENSETDDGTVKKYETREELMKAVQESLEEIRKVNPNFGKLVPPKPGGRVGPPLPFPENP